MRRILVILFAVCMAACTARVEYERPTVVASPNAININTATVDELERLPNIGRKTAEAIVRYRADNGAFRHVDQLLMIRGVSAGRLAEIRPLLRAE